MELSHLQQYGNKLVKSTYVYEVSLTWPKKVTQF